MQQFHFDDYCFFDFLLNGFPNPFIVHSSPSFFVWTSFPFLACGQAAFWHWFSVFFYFRNSLIVRSRSGFCLVNGNSLNCTSGLILLCFFLFRSQDFCYDHMTSPLLQIYFLFIRSCNLNKLRVWRHFSLLVEQFFVHSRDCCCSNLNYLTLKNDFLTLKLIFSLL